MVFASGFSDAPLRQQTDLPAGKSLLWGGSLYRHFCFLYKFSPFDYTLCSSLYLQKSPHPESNWDNPGTALAFRALVLFHLHAIVKSLSRFIFFPMWENLR